MVELDNKSLIEGKLMEMLIVIALLVGLYTATGFVSYSSLRKSLIEEAKFHLLTDDDQLRIVSGKRHRELQISEAENQLSAVNMVAKSARLNWPVILWRLYGPKTFTVVDTDLDKVRKIAAESQRRSLLIKAMQKGYENDPIISLLMKVQTDSSFGELSAKIEAGAPGIPIEIDKKEMETYSKEVDRSIEAEVVLMSVGKAVSQHAVQLKNGSSNSKNANAKAISSSSHVSVTVSSGSGSAYAYASTSNQVSKVSINGLPEGYSWDLGWREKGSEFEKMVVTLVGNNGQKVRSESFYTSVYGTESEQRSQIKDIQQKLVISAHHDLSGNGIDKNFLS